jgi:hypothetical protein
MTDGPARPKTTQATHEAFSRDETIVAGSDRSFGLVMAAAFGILTLLNAWYDGRLWPWTGGVAALFLAAALLRPAMLHPLNRLWLKFGLLLYKVMNPLSLGLLFFITIMPIGLVMRAFGKDFLRLKLDRKAKTYWIERAPPGPPPQSMRNQF